MRRVNADEAHSSTDNEMCVIIDHLHARTKEFINALIAVTSRLDAVVNSMNVLNPMENQ